MHDTLRPQRTVENTAEYPSHRGELALGRKALELDALNIFTGERANKHAISEDLETRFRQVTASELDVRVVEQKAPRHALDPDNPMSRSVGATMFSVLHRHEPDFLITHHFAKEDAGYGQPRYSLEPPSKRKSEGKDTKKIN